jgi:hypothetical protein
MKVKARMRRFALGVGLLVTTSVVAEFAIWRSGWIARPQRDSGLWSSQPASDLAGVAIRQPAAVPIALLVETYEHVREHVPPYGVDDEMQQRERFYDAPAEPFELCERKLKESAADASLRQMMEQMRKQSEQGGDTVSTPSGLESVAARSSLDAIDLLRASRGLQFLVGADAADSMCRAAITKAAEQYSGTAPGDPSALGFLHELDQTGLLWTKPDWPALEKRFALAERLNPAKSVEHRRAIILRSMSLFELAHVGESASEIGMAWGAAAEANDLTAKDMVELNWLTARSFFGAKQFAQAEPYCRAVLEAGGERSKLAARMDIICLHNLGRDDEAQAIRVRFGLAMPTQTRSAATTQGIVDH